MVAESEEEWRDWRDAFEYVAGVIVDESMPSVSSTPTVTPPTVTPPYLSDDEAVSLDQTKKSTLSNKLPSRLILDTAFTGLPVLEGMLYKQGALNLHIIYIL
jgi:hypothetical protein